MQDFKKLEVWKKADSLVLAVYKATNNFPKDEIYGLTSQIRRAAVSITANIAEGCGRNSKVELCQFLQISIGSANELDYYIHLASE
jgi:four helix bundle protein